MTTRHDSLAVLFLLGLWALPAAAQTIEDGASPPDPIDYAMFFLADVRDAAECAVSLRDGRFDYGPTVSNAAMTCPDAFAWSLFARIVTEGFWENWSTDRQVWPSAPWPRCTPGAEVGTCCAAVAIANEAAPEHCPVFPGETDGAPRHIVGEPSKAHQMELAAVAPDASWESVPAVLRNAVIGGTMVELVYRNQPMVDYIFDNELYYTEGLGAVFDRHARAALAYAPYQTELLDPAVNHDAPPPITQIVFPIRSVMVKVNWIAAKDAPKVGIDPGDSEHPYIVMDLMPQGADKDAAPEPYLMLSFHISSKDLPNWFWATFEHVANQGRCDWLGCNDSFGYRTTQTLAIDGAEAGGLPPPAANYIAPAKVANEDQAGVEAFAVAGTYHGVDRIGDELAAILDALEIGTGAAAATPGLPTRQDLAWRSYRLKGSQVDWVTSEGRPTRLGNSVTEAGFVNTASCLTCHAQAAVDERGLLIHAIFEDTLSDVGLAQSANGVVDQNFFHSNAFWGLGGQFESLAIHAIQTDFVWGFRFTCPAGPLPYGPSWCAHVTGPGYSTPVPAPDTDTSN